MQIIDERKPDVSTVQYGEPQLPGTPSYIPRAGLDFLYGIPSAHIEQTYELYDCKKNIMLWLYIH